MKRILIIFSLLIATFPAFAQTITFEGLKRTLENSNADIQHAKRKTNPKTWLDRGIAFMNAAEVNTQFLRLGMPVAELTLFMKDPGSKETIETTDGPKEVFVYERVKVSLQNGVVIGWKETESVHPDPLPEALTALKKGIELDTKGRYEKQIKDNLNRLNNLFLNKGILAYQEQDFAESYRFFANSINVIELPQMQDLPADTAIYFNTGLVASFANMHKEALKYYNRAKDMNYGGGNLFVLIKDQYMALGDTASAVKTLQEGFSKFPDDNSIVIELTNYYIASEKTQEAMNYLNIAKKLEPTNASLYFAEGFLFEKSDKPEKAIESYNKAIELNPEYFDALYNLGAAWYNQAVKKFEMANEIMDNKAFIVARNAAIETLAKAVPYMERAHIVNPSDRSTLETLRILYYRLQINDKEKEVIEKLKKL